MPKKDWKEQARKRLMILSATQLETFELCKRKWWFKSVRKLPDPDTGSQIFGTVLHAVIERYLKGDSQGRGPDGKPVELYPPDWHLAMNRYEKGKVDGAATPGEQEIIKMLVGKAIEEGILECFDDREIEYEFRETLLQLQCPDCHGKEYWPAGQPCDICGCPYGGEHIQAKHDEAANEMGTGGEDPVLCGLAMDPPPWTCPTCHGDGKGVHVQITGFIDYATADGIQDHKSVKRMAYAKSKNELKENIQMLTCAKVLLRMYEQAGNPAPAKISLRHNVYCKDADDLRVRKTEVFVAPEDIEGNWTKIKEMATEMAMMRAKAKNWHDTPDPASFARACNAYGGCRFRTICQGQESEESFEKRLDPNLRNDTIITSQTPTTFTEEKSMSIASRIAQRGLASAAAGAATTMPPGGGVNPPASAPVTQSPPATVPATQAAPQQAAPVQQQPTQQAAPQQAAAPVANAAPWANPNCVSCSGIGFNSAGAPCRICDLKAVSLNKKPSKDYVIEVLGDGTAYWKDRANETLDGVAPMHAAGQAPGAVKAENKTELPATQAAPQVNTLGGVQSQVVQGVQETPGTVAAQVQTQPQQAAPQQAATNYDGTPATPSQEKGKRGRKAGSKNKSADGSTQGFILVLGGVVSQGEGESGVQRIGDIFRRVTVNIMAEAVKAGQAKEGDTFYDLDPFRRRDVLTESGEDIAAEFGSDHVVVDRLNPDPDMRALIDGIRHYASLTINGITL